MICVRCLPKPFCPSSQGVLQPAFSFTPSGLPPPFYGVICSALGESTHQPLSPVSFRTATSCCNSSRDSCSPAHTATYLTKPKPRPVPFTKWRPTGPLAYVPKETIFSSKQAAKTLSLYSQPL